MNVSSVHHDYKPSHLTDLHVTSPLRAIDGTWRWFVAGKDAETDQCVIMAITKSKTGADMKLAAMLRREAR